MRITIDPRTTALSCLPRGADIWLQLDFFCGDLPQMKTTVFAPRSRIFRQNLDLLVEGHRQPVQVHAAMPIDPESMLQCPPSGDFFVGGHRAMEVVTAVSRRRMKLDDEILMMVDGSCEDEVSGGGFGRWKRPWAEVAGD